MSQKTAAEQHLARLQRRALKHLLARGQGMTVRVFSVSKDTHTKAYGSASGSRSSTYREIEGIPTGDDFFPADIFRSTSFQEGWLWTNDQEIIQGGQEVQFLSPDGRTRRFIVQTSESLGWTTEIFTRYRLSAVDRP